MKQIKIILAVLSVMMLILLTGCGSEQKSSQSEQQNSGIAANGQSSSSAGSSDSKQQAGKTKITVYFPDKNGEKLIPASKTVDLSSDSKYTAAVKALLQGPASGEGIAIVPKNTKLLGTSIDDKGIVTVNFDNAFVKNFTGGSTGEIMLIGSITDTLTNFQEVKAVRFCVEGKPLDALSGHLDLTSPVTRMKDIL